MPTVYLAPDPINSTQLIPGGVVLASGGKLFQYLAGSSTKTDTYTDITGTVKWSNPIVLDSGGNLGGSNEVWIPAGVTVKFVLAPFNDTDPPIAPYKTWDNLSGINDPTSLLTEWVVGPTPTFVSTTSFTLVGDQTAIFTPGRRVKTTNTAGTRYGTISTSVFGAVTTVTITNDSGVLDAGLSAVWYALINPKNTSLPLIVSVLNFGAKGDGVTDDTAAIQAAIQAAIASVGRALFVPNGRYRCNSTVTLTKVPYLTIYGEGARIAATHAVDPSSIVGSVFVNGVSGVLFDITETGTGGQYFTRNITFDGIGVDQLSDANDIAFQVSAQGNKLRFRNGGIDHGKYGVAFTGTSTPYDAKWENFDFFRMKSGVFFPYAVTSDYLNMQWEDCTIRYCTRYAVEAQNGDSFYFKNNIIEACTLGGLYLAGVYYVGMDANHFEQNGAAGTGLDVYVLSNATHGGTATTKVLRCSGNTYTRDSANAQAVQFKIDAALSMIFEGEGFSGGVIATGLTINTPGAQSAVFIGGHYDTGRSITGAGIVDIPRVTDHLLLGTVTDNASGDKAGILQLAEAATSGLYLGNTNNTGLKVLDWYEEGTWTPDLKFGGSNTGITGTQTGGFTRSGNVITAWGHIALTSKGAQVGNATVTGLPYTIANTTEQNNSQGAMAYYSGMTGLTGALKAIGGGQNTTSVLIYQDGAAAAAAVTDAAFTNASNINFTIVYHA